MVDSAKKEDGEVIESVDSVKDKAAKVIVPAEASGEEQEQKLKQTDAMLDMILTIVGEEYGQRDLLVARDVLWDV